MFLVIQQTLTLQTIVFEMYIHVIHHATWNNYTGLLFRDFVLNIVLGTTVKVQTFKEQFQLNKNAPNTIHTW